MKTLSSLVFAVFSVMFLTPPPLQANSLQSISEIEQTAYVFAMQQARMRYDNPQVIVDSLDPRLRLHPCERGMEAFANRDVSSAGSQTIGVRCRGPVSWTIYVPTRIRVMQAAVVAARPLSANHVLTSEDIRTEMVDIGNLRQGVIGHSDLVLGQTLRHPIAAGTVLSNNNFRQQATIKRGEFIQLIATVGKMEVRMQGTAMADAMEGERLRVRNSSSERIVEGIVDGPGRVRVSM
ncbi:flagellar basal-body P-ring formation protein FlgA [Methylophaga lonarensis MPL]|uniref:Flagella basal body P-ring formation protein FlgA n=1 Tax=Methylophaga lonarensis MPL TaxID=1286106 RepID=M7P2N0_9GAMM|nr:flagellar basal body P-ring formation chaperone FlgA [Methylophaga lonarensis]EMR13742.1 flagellar basal-body P-ring formation protein FlgA [Methylophaga lonarensis MPL]